MSDNRTMFYGASPQIFEKAKKLRDNMTYHEKILWNELKANKQLGFRFKPQHPIGSFIADFYCHKLKLVIEIDGASHESVDAREYDNGREEEMSAFGIVTLRFSNEEVEANMASILNEIKETCIHIAENQLITPSLKGADDLNLKQSITPALKGGTVYCKSKSPLQGVWGQKQPSKR